MKNLLLYSALLFFVCACNSEGEVEPAEGTFLRYFGSEKNHTAVLALEANEGFVMLSNLEVQEGTTIGSKIKLTRTDLNGNFQWEKSFPAFVAEGDEDNTYTANSFTPLQNSGYIIVGDRINSNGTHDALVLHLDSEGNLLASRAIQGIELDASPTLYDGASLGARSLIESEDSEGQFYLLLGSIANANNGKDMFIARLNPADLSIVWSREYGSAESTLVNRLFKGADEQLVWASTVSFNAQQDVRLIRVAQDSETPVIGDPLTSPTIDEDVKDICRTAGGYALVGATNQGGGDDNIFLMKVSGASQLVFFKTYPSSESTTEGQRVDFGLNDMANAVCNGSDGGFAILATVESPTTEQDIYLIKADGTTGEISWAKSFGGDDRDEAASIRPLNDGSYLIFGTSYFGRVKKLLLMKVNRFGDL